jgi:hypothetical protein
MPCMEEKGEKQDEMEESGGKFSVRGCVFMHMYIGRERQREIIRVSTVQYSSVQYSTT